MIIMPMTAGRRLWLAIGLPVCLVLVAWIGLNLVAVIGPGQFPVRHDVPVRGGRVTVNVSEGRVHLQGGLGGQATLTGAAHYTLVRPRLTTTVSPAGTEFGYDCKFPVGNCDLDATVTVPRGTASAVHTGGGDATVQGTSSAVTVTTNGGNVSADQVSGNLTLTTDGGDITAAAITAPWVAATTSGGGDVTVVFTRVPVNVSVTTDGGSITIVVPPGRTHYRLTEHTGGGTTSGQIPTDSSSPDVITATTRGGDITVRQS